MAMSKLPLDLLWIFSSAKEKGRSLKIGFSVCKKLS
jgi:hypothetical protein